MIIKNKFTLININNILDKTEFYNFKKWFIYLMGVLWLLIFAYSFYIDYRIVIAIVIFIIIFNKVTKNEYIKTDDERLMELTNKGYIFENKLDMYILRDKGLKDSKFINECIEKDRDRIIELSDDGELSEEDKTIVRYFIKWDEIEKIKEENREKKEEDRARRKAEEKVMKNRPKSILTAYNTTGRSITVEVDNGNNFSLSGLLVGYTSTTVTIRRDYGNVLVYNVEGKNILSRIDVKYLHEKVI